MTSLETQFHKAMIGIYRRARDECGYLATRFLGLVSEKGGVEAAHVLLSTRRPSQGFTALWERGRLDLTMEALLLDPKYSSLFTEEELQVARSRLTEYGYEIGSRSACCREA